MMKFSHVVILILIVLTLIAAAPLQVEPPVDPAPTAEPGLPPLSPPDAQSPDYAGFVASAALVLAATAFVKTRLGLTGELPVLGTAFAIVLAIAFYPDVLVLLPEGAQGVVDKFVYGVLIPFISATGGYDLTSGVFGLFKKATK